MFTKLTSLAAGNDGGDDSTTYLRHFKVGLDVGWMTALLMLAYV